jgi:PD-(D/E)XK nuclease superfamily protein
VKFSNSESQTWKQCRRKWYLAYYLGYKAPEKVTGALALGTNVHTALAAGYAPGGSPGLSMGILSAIYEESRSKATDDLIAFDKEAKLAKIMVEGYWEWVEETGADSNLEILEAEVDIEHPIEVHGQSIRLVGKRDAIGVNTETGIATLIDHKTCQTLTDPALDLNEQSRMYLLLQRLNGSTVVQNCIWNLLRKVQRTAKAVPPFYAREEIYVSEDELRRFWTRVHGTVRDILAIRERLDAGESHYSVCYPSPSRDCSWKCEFRVVCPLLDSEGDNALQFLKDNYTAGDPYQRYESKGSE